MASSTSSNPDQAMRIGVAGITGRMGRLVADEVLQACATLSGGSSRASALTFADLGRASDAIVDFTTADAALLHAGSISAGRCAWVLGTTGLSPAAEAAVRRAALSAPVVWAANFSPGVTLLLHLARRLATALPQADYDAEILEMHHRHKRDSPSGTALALGQAVADARGTTLDAAGVRARDGQTGERPPGAIGFASLRGGEIVGEHTLLFAGAAEHISISHKALDRRIFAAGAVRAALWARGRPPGLYTMADVIGLTDEGLAP